MFGIQRKIAAILLAASVISLSACGDAVAIQDIGDVFVRNGAVTLAGTLDVPSGPGPFPVMVFVTGSGTTTRSDDRGALDIALPQGIAVFRYDKRGLGQSTGTFEEVFAPNSTRVLADRASDVTAIVEYLSKHTRIKHDQIFLWGTSQGAWVAPLVAARTNKLAFIICVVGGASPVGTVLEYGQIGRRDPSLSIAEMTKRVSTFAGPFGYDPLPAVTALSIPTLWIYGGQDRFTPFQLDTARIQQLHKSNFTVKVFPRMNHDLIDVDTGQYPETLFPEVLAWGGPRLGLARR